MSPPDVEDFLAQPHIAVAATLRSNGLPYTVPVWHHWDGEHVWVTGTSARVWCRQLMADGRVSLCVEALEPLPGHVGIDGHAEVLQPPEFDIWPMTEALVQKYVGRGDPARADAAAAFLANMRTEPRLLVRITPQVWRAIDMRVYEGKRADRQHQQGAEETS